MAIKRPALIFVTTCFLASLAWMPVFAMDLTIAPTATGVVRTASVAGKKQRFASSEQKLGTEHVEAARVEQKKRVTGEKSRRHEKFRRNKITTYSLFSVPAFSHVNPTSDGLRQFGPVSRAVGLGPGLTSGVAGVAPLPGLAVMPDARAATINREQPAESAGIAFDCREKSSLALREVTACYVHRVDKSWKTRTYVTKGLADSDPGWGGGLAVGYTY